MNYENIPFNQNEHDWMVTYFQTTAPTNKDWISDYLKHIKYIIDKLQLHNSDKRFVLTLPKTISYPIFLPVIIGDRYVLGGYYRDDLDDNPSVVIILQNHSWEKLSEKQQNNIEMKADLFKPYPTAVDYTQVVMPLNLLIFAKPVIFSKVHSIQ